MLKIFDLGTHFSAEEPTLNVIDLDAYRSRKGMEKRAATDPEIQQYIASLSPQQGKTYVHILAMSAMEYYGQNRNSDSFPETNLIRSHDTFVTLPGLIFRNHKNRDKTKAIGQIIHSVYNPRMHRVEVIAELWNEKCPDVVERMEHGDWPATSMSCRLPYDTCSICGNQAKTRSEYCTHLRNELGKIYPDGRRVSAINDAPLSLFEVSVVGRPADPISSILQKVASSEDDVIGSAELAELEGMKDVEKNAAFKKLSEMIKEIQGDPVSCSKNLETILDRIKDPDLATLDSLPNYPIPSVLASLAEMGMSPSVEFLAEMIARQNYGQEGVGVGEMVSQYLQGEGLNKMASSDLDQMFDIADSSPYITRELQSSMLGSSMYPQFVEQRALGMYAPIGNLGYIGNGPKIHPSKLEMLPKREKIDSALLGKILKIGAAALAAKWYISNIIERKVREAQLSQQSNTKIVLVKSAKEYNSVLELAKSAMIKALNTYNR